MGDTKKNLSDAFAGESQANRHYFFFAEKADKEGHPQVARLFRAVAEAETVHAHNHLEVMGGIGSTEDNLKEAAGGENYEFTRISFDYANKVEQIHYGLYQETIKTLGVGQEPKEEPYFVCQFCGNTVAGEAPEKCPICGAPRSKFKRVE